MNKNVAVIIRAAGERTEELSQKLIEQQVPGEMVSLIRERPFRKAVEQSFQIGLEKAMEWTLTIDADVLTGDKVVHNMLQQAKQFGRKLFFYQGYVYDKLFGKPLQGGPHLFRTEHLEKAIKLITDKDTAWRPEANVNYDMAKAGYRCFIDDQIFGLHDFEQYYRDLFRKGFFRAIKHNSPEVNASLLENWIERLREDKDYDFAMEGWITGFRYQGEIKNDIEFFKQHSEYYLQKLDFEEKAPLSPVEVQELAVHYGRFLQELKTNKNFPLRKKMLHSRKYGLKFKIVYKIGRELINMGKRLTGEA